ncbi:MAG: GNAT family N-acetyltransferase [Candidatus Babeliales bacterium]
MIMQNRSMSRIKAALAVVSIMVGAGLAYYATHARETGPICDFNEARDADAVKKIFKDDWYWLSNREYIPENIDFVLKTHSPNEYEPRYYGKMSIKVLREHDTLIGFITYYMLNFYEGKILFLAINPDFRGKRYGEPLIKYAINDFFNNRGATVVRLVTRVDNTSAQKLYIRIGFVETGRDLEDGFIHYAIKKVDWQG